MGWLPGFAKLYRTMQLQRSFLRLLLCKCGSDVSLCPSEASEQRLPEVSSSAKLARGPCHVLDSQVVSLVT